MARATASPAVTRPANEQPSRPAASRRRRLAELRPATEPAHFRQRSPSILRAATDHPEPQPAARCRCQPTAEPTPATAYVTGSTAVRSTSRPGQQKQDPNRRVGHQQPEPARAGGAATTTIGVDAWRQRPTRGRWAHQRQRLDRTMTGRPRCPQAATSHLA